MNLQEANIQQLLNQRKYRKAFNALVDLYQEALYWMVRKIVFHHEDAQDVVQNTFVKLWNRMDQINPDKTLKSFLFTIAYNEAIDTYRRNKKRRSSDVDELTYLKQDALVDYEALDVMFKASVENLPEQQRIIFNLRYFDELAHKEIAVILEMSEGGVKSSYSIAVKKIKEALNLLEL